MRRVLHQVGLTLAGGGVALATCLTVSSCTSLLVDDRPLRSRHVLAGRATTGGGLTYDELHRGGSYLSTSSDLEPLRAVLDEHLGGDVTIIGGESGRFVPLPAGEVTFVNWLTPTGSVDIQAVTGLSAETLYHGTFRLDVFSLPGELTTFTGAVNPLLALGGLPPIAAPLIAVPPVGALRQLLDGLVVRLAGARSTVGGGVVSARWVLPDPRFETPLPSGATPPEPVLEIVLRLDTGESVQAGLVGAIGLNIPMIDVAVRIQPNVCALPSGAGAGNCTLARQRNGAFLGYDGRGGNAAAEDTNVDVTIRLGEAALAGDVTAVTLPGCPLIPGLGPLLCAELNALLPLVGPVVEGPLAQGAGNAVVGLLSALSTSLPNVTFVLGGVPIDVGTVPFSVAASGAGPAFTAPFGGTGGLWGVTAMMGIARGGILCPSPGTPACPIPTVPGVVPLTVAPTPNLAPIVSTAPYVANESRAIFTAPVMSLVRPPSTTVGVPVRDTVETFARYSSITVGTDPANGDVAARMSFVLDLDGDGVRDFVDSCIEVPDLGIDADFDNLDDACDSCVGVASTDRRDGDGDGEADVCDCDVDGDGCIDLRTHPISGLSCGAGAVLDRSATPASGDADGDSLPDDCDPDSDNDEVLDEVDNCRLVPNADQQDSGGLDEGDACDLLCPGPAAPGCAFDPGRSGFSGGGFREFDFIPGGMEAICRSSRDGCFDLWSIRRCFAGGPGCFDTLTAWSAQTLDIEQQLLTTDRAGAIRTLSPLTDLDGDGLTEMAVGLPFAEHCDAERCDVRAGQVLVLGSREGRILLELNGPARGARLGESTVAFGHYLAIGAPGMRNSSRQRGGAVFVYHLGYEPPRLVGSFYGADRKEKLGRALSLAGDRDGDGLPELLVAAPGARGRAGREAGRVEARTFAGRLLQIFEGPTARARLGDDSAVLLSRQQSPEGVMVGASREGRGGAVVFFGWDGRQRWIVRGPRGAALGTSLAPAADFDHDGRFEVAVGAPGSRRDAGSVWMLDAFGRLLGELTVPGARRLGEHVGVPGDLDGDGQFELGVSFRHGSQDAQGTLILRRAGQSPPPPNDGPL